MTVTVYTKPDCVQCDATKNHLAKLGIAFTVEPMDDGIRARAAEFGITSAPIVEVHFGPEQESQFWGGYRSDRIKALVS